MKPPLSAESFFATLSVPRDVAARLAVYADLLRRWQPRINLVGSATLDDLWRRHFHDSAQLLPWLGPGPLLDLGSGAGFPGLVLAILRAADADTHLVESDGRKVAFLREVARATGTRVILHPCRIEQLPAFPVDTVTARALAPLPRLLQMAAPFLSPASQCLFLKGQKLEDELTDAGKDWKMRVERIPSHSDPDGIILRVKEVYRGRVVS